MPTPRKALAPEERIAKIVSALRTHPGVTPPSAATPSKKAFGSSGLKINNKIFAMISSTGTFVVKLPAARVDGLIASGAGKRFDPGHGRLMKEWLAVAPTSRADWLCLAREALAFVASQ